MNLEQYILKLSEKLSRVKKQILQELWGAGRGFPRNWISSSRLLELTGQKYFDRRVREMRDELGCDIETGTHKGEHSYRLLSDHLRTANIRAYLTNTQKKKLFTLSQYTCEICGKKSSPGVKGLQADHKIPLIRGGPHNERNWQSICNVCNVGKRRACEGCDDDCRECPWAFPEKFGHIRLVGLPPALDKRLQKLTKGKPSAFQKLVRAALEKFIQ